MNIIKELQNYKRLKAEIRDIELDIEELNDNKNIGPSAISYTEKTGQTYKFNSETENEAIRIADKINFFEKQKRIKEREIERIDNALSILDDKENLVLQLKLIDGRRWGTVTYKLDRSYCQCKAIEREALKKIDNFINNRKTIGKQ